MDAPKFLLIRYLIKLESVTATCIITTSDKGYIFREIYDQMISSWEKAYDRAENRSSAIDTLKRFIEDSFEFFARCVTTQYY